MTLCFKLPKFMLVLQGTRAQVNKIGVGSATDKYVLQPQTPSVCAHSLLQFNLYLVIKNATEVPQCFPFWVILLLEKFLLA